ncbi:MAG: carboxypeptidase-like regulatory domain-containing protein [Treponema sp.]|jgi:hypothetical protein|nr:carboxypeptidase-like regulatory domain-containing protein [Treponema sp.]
MKETKKCRAWLLPVAVLVIAGCGGGGGGGIPMTLPGAVPPASTPIPPGPGTPEIPPPPTEEVSLELWTKGAAELDSAYVQVMEVDSLIAAYGWLLSGNIQSNTAYKVVLHEDMTMPYNLSVGSILHTNIIVTLEGDGSVRTIKAGGQYCLEILDGITIVLGNNMTLRGRNMTDDGGNNRYPLVYVNGGDLVMKDGSEISGNIHAEGVDIAAGGAVWIHDGGFAMEGGTIKDNAVQSPAGAYGGGVFLEAGGSFTMSGSAKVDANNEVCLMDGAELDIAAALTGTNPVATLRPYFYIDGEAALTGSLVSTQYNKFAVVPDGAIPWSVTAAGKFSAPSYTISGTVTTTPTASDLTQITVQLARDGQNSGASVQANATGFYQIQTKAGSGYTVKASLSGYMSSESAEFPVTGNTTQNLILTTAGVTTIYEGAVVKHAGTFADCFAWLDANVTSNTAYTIDVGSNETITQKTLNWPSRTGVSVTLSAGTPVELSLSTADLKMFSIKGGVTFILDSGITLKGHSTDHGSVATWLVCAEESTFIMNTGSMLKDHKGIGAAIIGGNFTMNAGAKITGMQKKTNGVSGGVQISRSNNGHGPLATFTMEGGEISNNFSDIGGGGVTIMGTSTFIMKGGTISNNTASSWGGGVWVNGGTFLLQNGTISNNTVDTGRFASGDCLGGGVCYTGYGEVPGSFTMEGGTISGNTLNIHSDKIGPFTEEGAGVAVNLTNVDVSVSYSFTKTGGTIYGSGAGANSNTVKRDGVVVTSNSNAVWGGMYTISGVYLVITTTKHRETTAGSGVNLSLNGDGTATGSWDY